MPILIHLEVLLTGDQLSSEIGILGSWTVYWNGKPGIQPAEAQIIDPPMLMPSIKDESYKLTITEEWQSFDM